MARMEQAAPQAGPSSGRVLAIDVLRGAAILGILLFNLHLFAMHPAAFNNPYGCPWTDKVNVTVWVLMHIFIGHKDLTVFSMLFGSGMVRMGQRLSPQGQVAAETHYRRMGVLLLIGLAHAYLVWSGDILVTYALCGLVLHGLRNIRPTWQIVLGLLVYAVPLLLLMTGDRLLASMLSAERIAQVYDSFRPTAEDWAQHAADYSGPWWSQFTQRIGQTLMIQLLLIPTALAWVAGGMMLVGMGLSRLGMFDGRWSKRTYVVLTVGGLALGWSLIAFGVYKNFHAGWAAEYSMIRGRVYVESASPVVAVGWISLWVLICNAGRLPWLTSRLAAVGRMAITNYLLTSVIATFIFYGVGLGWIGRVDRVQLLGIAVAIGLFQLVASPVWLRYFRLGPIEWLWRTLSYWRWQPLRVQASETVVEPSGMLAAPPDQDLAQDAR